MSDTNDVTKTEADLGPRIDDVESETVFAADEPVDAAGGLVPSDEGEAASRGEEDLLEREGEIGADYIVELLDIADVDGDIVDIDVDHGRATVSVLSEDGQPRSLQRLVGPDGEVLTALQELTRLAVQAQTGERSRLMLDIAGYRAGRRAELTKTAQAAIAEVQETGQALALDPMNAFERKVVHDVVAAAGLVSESEGVDPNRRVVIRA